MTGLRAGVRALADELRTLANDTTVASPQMAASVSALTHCADRLDALLAEDQTPASSDDIEALADELGCEYHPGNYGACASCSAQAERVIDSDWLAERERAAEQQGIRIAAQLVRDHVLSDNGERIARFLEGRADRIGGAS